MKISRPKTRCSALAAIVLSVAACAQSTSPEGEHAARGAAGMIAALSAESATPIGTAIATALAKQPGTVLEAELEAELEDGVQSFAYEIVIRAADGRVFTARVARHTGDLIGVEAEDEADEIAEMRAISDALPAGSKPLAELIAAAEKHTGGRALAAEFEVEDGGVECELLVVADGNLLEVEVDAATGEVLEVEADDDDDDDDDDADDDDDDDRHHDGDDDD